MSTDTPVNGSHFQINGLTNDEVLVVYASPFGSSGGGTGVARYSPVDNDPSQIYRVGDPSTDDPFVLRAVAADPANGWLWTGTSSGCNPNVCEVGGRVWRVDLDSEAELSTHTTGTTSITAIEVFGAPPVPLVQPDCADEDINRELGPVAEGDRVTVRFDPRFIVDRSLFSDSDADAVARHLQLTAEDALDYFGSLGLPIPPNLKLEVSCELDWFQVPIPLNRPVPGNPTGFVGGARHVQLRADYVEFEFVEAVRNGFAPGAWSAPNADWREQVAHEVFHAVQWEVDSLAVRNAGQDHTFVESPAVLATDLFAATDDIQDTQYFDQLSNFAANPARGFDVAERDLTNQVEYQAAGALQYWAERFGPQTEANLERRAAAFLNALIRAPFQTLRWADGEVAAFGATLGYDYGVPGFPDSAYGPLDDGYRRGLDALRDYYAAHFALQTAGRVPEPANRYQLLDATTGHGLTPGVPPGAGLATYPDITVGTLDVTTGPDTHEAELGVTEGEVLLVDVSATTVAVEFEVTAGDADDPDSNSALRLAYIPIENDGDAVMDPAMMPVGPLPGEAAPSRVISTIGRTAVAIVV